MLKLKGCPRCKGDVLVDKDWNGWYEQCLQCGYVRDLPPMASPLASQAKVRKVNESK